MLPTSSPAHALHACAIASTCSSLPTRSLHATLSASSNPTHFFCYELVAPCDPLGDDSASSCADCHVGALPYANRCARAPLFVDFRGGGHPCVDCHLGTPTCIDCRVGAHFCIDHQVGTLPCVDRRFDTPPCINCHIGAPLCVDCRLDTPFCVDCRAGVPLCINRHLDAPPCADRCVDDRGLGSC